MGFSHIQVREPTSPMTMQEGVYAPYPPAPSSTNFSILAIAIIGIVATAFLLVSYYVFVIKCCLNWHRFGHRLRAFRSLRDFRPSDPGNHHQLLPMVYPPENQGLEEHIIQSIPIFRFKRKDSFLCEDLYECSVCLNEFEEGQKLRILPKCGHAFHIDCIDTWLQAHSNCPLCRAYISNQVLTHQYMMDLEDPRQETCQSFHSGLLNGHSRENVHSSSSRLAENGRESGVVEGGGQKAVESGFLEVRFTGAEPGKRLRQHQHHLSSGGDECIDVRERDEQFCVEPIRRSFSMDFDADRHLYISLTDIFAQNPHLREVSSNTGEECSSSRGVRRTFFPFGHGRGIPRNAVLPIKVEAGTC